MEAVALPFPVAGGDATVGLSVGVALAGPGATADSLLAAADAALYESKQAGGGRATTRAPRRAAPMCTAASAWASSGGSWRAGAS